MVRFVSLVTVLFAANLARAQTLQAPVGAKPIALGEAVFCEEADGWSIEGEGRLARPRPEAKVGAAVEVRVAASARECAEKSADRKVTLVTTGSWPQIDPASVVLAADEGWLELKGERLDGMQLHWQSGERSGDDNCLQPTAGKTQRCLFTVGKGLPIDSTLSLSWLPAGARRGPEVVTFGPRGRAVDAGELELRPAKVLLGSLLPPTGAVDITSGFGRIPLTHPEAVAAVDCGTARCELGEGAVVVRSVPGLVNAIPISLRLSPRVYVVRGESLDTGQTGSVAVLHCPIALASGAPLRDVEESRLVVRMDGRCGGEAQSLRWSINNNPADLLRVERDGEAAYVLLRTGRLLDDRFTLVAQRPEPDGSVLAVLSGKTAPAPQVRPAIELPGYGRIDFIPSNRDAAVRTLPVGEHGKLVPLGVRGAYDVRSAENAVWVRGDENAAGFVSMRFGYRVDTVPPAFANTDLAILTEPLQRTVREACVPASISASAKTESPLVELVCVGDHGHPESLEPGSTARIPFSQRDSCRVIIHRERLKPEEGPQEVALEITVSSLDGASRSEAHVSERMILRPAKESRVFWIQGVKRQFDRITVRVAHVIDESRFMGNSDTVSSAPSVQWAVVVGEGRLRLYATTTIPTGLYRLTEPRGILTLNFGVMSRMTWLDETGHEGLFGFELGVMGVGLVKTESYNFPPTLATLAGFGISIPLGNRGEPSQATVNLHAWGVYEFRGDIQCSEGAPCPPNHRFAFYFGPSISVGNVGMNL